MLSYLKKKVLPVLFAGVFLVALSASSVVLTGCSGCGEEPEATVETPDNGEDVTDNGEELPGDDNDSQDP